MYDDIFHFGVVDRALRRAAPGFFGAGIIGEHPDDVEFFQVGKLQRLGVFNPAPEHQMQFCVVQAFCPLVFFLGSLSGGLSGGLYSESGLADKVTKLFAHRVAI